MFFERLKELRSYEGYTQKDIAKLLNVKRATYAGWECGKDIIPLRQVYKIANAYQVNIDYILGLTNKEERIHIKDNIDIKKVSDSLKKFRKEHNITQKEIAKVLKTSQANIHKYETGKCLITTIYAIEFSKNYNYSLDVLLGRKRKKDEN